MIRFFNCFVKITGYLVQKVVFRTKIYYEDKSVQSRKIKGSAILISNHTSVYDYAVFLFTFFFRTLRYQMAEILYKKKLLALFLKCMGGIYVNRDTHDFSFIYKSEEILKKGGIVGIFPESRIPKEGEDRPLPFKVSAAYLALSSDVKVIPIYTDGVYFKKNRARIIIGTPIYARDFSDENLDEKENITRVTEAFRNKIIELGEKLDERKREESQKK